MENVLPLERNRLPFLCLNWAQTLTGQNNNCLRSKLQNGHSNHRSDGCVLPEDRVSSKSMHNPE